MKNNLEKNICIYMYIYIGGASLVAQMVKNLLAMQSLIPR